MVQHRRRPVIPADDFFAAARAEGLCDDRRDAEIVYQRLSGDFRGVPRGTLRVEGRVVPGYPHIGRIFALARGIARNFDGPFFAEEKIDGYNLRLFSAHGRILPVTRSGLVCPFSRDRLADLLDIKGLQQLFADHSDLVICAEVAGPNNPYNDSTGGRVAHDVALFAFDVMRMDAPELLPIAERDALFETYAIPAVPRLGRFTAADSARLAQIILRLDHQGGEGIVLKPPAAGLRLKYVTPHSNVTDVAAEAALELELPGEFYIHRVVRLAMGLRELGLTPQRDALGAALGQALVAGFDSALGEVSRTGEVARVVVVNLRSEASIDALLEHLNRSSRTVRAYEIDRRHHGDFCRLTFRKVFKRSTSKLATLLAGDVVFD